jgi:hypothetical protein
VVPESGRLAISDQCRGIRRNNDENSRNFFWHVGAGYRIYNFRRLWDLGYLVAHHPCAAMTPPAMNKMIVVAGVVVIEIAMAIALIPWTDQSRVKNTDFLNFYAAATLVRQGDGQALYRADTASTVYEAILGHKTSWYFLHPPFEAAALVPLSYVSVGRAFTLWTLMNLALVGAMPLLLADCVSFLAAKPYLGLTAFIFPPVVTCLALGQDSIVILFVITAAYLLYRKNREVAAGLVLALASIKFQYVLIFAILLFFSRKFRFLSGLIAGGTVLILFSLTIVGFRGMSEYFKFMQEFALHIRPDLMVNCRGFLTGTGWVNHVGFYSTAASVLFIVAAILCARYSLRTKTGTSSLLFSLFVAAAFIASPYAHFADASMLLLPMSLAFGDRRDWKIAEKLIAVSSALMFGTPLVLMSFGGHYWWNSRIYWMFPVILLFTAGVALALLEQRGPRFSHPSENL